MKEVGIRGTSNGFRKNGTKAYYAIKLDHNKRDIRNINKMDRALPEFNRIINKKWIAYNKRIHRQKI
jgi:hypothetical protein